MVRAVTLTSYSRNLGIFLYYFKNYHLLISSLYGTYIGYSFLFEDLAAGLALLPGHREANYFSNRSLIECRWRFVVQVGNLGSVLGVVQILALSLCFTSVAHTDLWDGVGIWLTGLIFFGYYVTCSPDVALVKTDSQDPKGMNSLLYMCISVKESCLLSAL